MRYRRISYRFAEVTTGRAARPLGDLWAAASRVMITRPQWRPPADLYETPDAFVVRVELAAVPEEEIDITVYHDALVVEGVRRCECPDDARYHAAEIRYGPFLLEIPFPSAIDRNGVAAHSRDGFLIVTLPKVERSRP
jgi:HSP20 family protein